MALVQQKWIYFSSPQRSAILCLMLSGTGVDGVTGQGLEEMRGVVDYFSFGAKESLGSEIRIGSPYPVR